MMIEPLIKKSECLFQDRLYGSVHEDFDSCINEVIGSACGQLFDVLKSDKGYAKNADEVLKSREDILTAISRLKTAIESPVKLINEYRS